jgi:baculoviral IAP repeat-containing protein 6
MADSELTVRCLIGQQWEVSSTCGLEDWMWDDGEITWTTDASGEVEVVPPLYTYFKKLTKQSEAFLAGAVQMFDEGGEAEVDEMIVQGTSLCGDIIAARDDLERAITFLGQPSSDPDRETRSQQEDSAQKDRKKRGKGKGKKRDMQIQVDKVYEEACEKLSFKHVSLADAATTQHGSGLHYSGYNYAAQLNQTQNASRNPRNRLHLLKELAVTATSLPPGVWVRVDEVRNDAMYVQHPSYIALLFIFQQ